MEVYELVIEEDALVSSNCQPHCRRPTSVNGTQVQIISRA